MELVFDIGANRGRTSEIFINEFDRVIAFEPNPILSKLLKNKFQGSNIFIDERAISHQRGAQEFRMSSADAISTLSIDWIENSRFTGEYTWEDSVIVDTISLQDAINEYGVPNYIKIDVEGYEYEILTNFYQLLPETLFSFEWAEEQKEKIGKILLHLNLLGYTKFSYTEEDEVLYDHQIKWFNYSEFKLISILDPDRKSLWGMIYFKK